MRSCAVSPKTARMLSGMPSTLMVRGIALIFTDRHSCSISSGRNFWMSRFWKRFQGRTWKVILPDKANLEAWLKEAGNVQRSDTKKAAPRTRLETKSYPGGVVFETFDEAFGDQAVLHTNVIPK